MESLKVTVTVLSKFETRRLDYILGLNNDGATIIDTVSSNPKESLVGPLGLPQFINDPVLGDGAAKHRTYQLDPLGRAFRARGQVLHQSEHQWNAVLSKEAVSQAKGWFMRVRPDLPADLQVYDRVWCSLSLLSCAQIQMEGLYALPSVNAYVFHKEHILDSVSISDGSTMLAASVSQSMITELSEAQFYEKDVDLKKLERTLNPLTARLISKEDFTLAPGSKISRAADRIVRDIVEDYFDHANHWRPTFYADIASDPYSS